MMEGIIALIAALGGTAGLIKIINAIKKREATPETLQLMKDIGELKEEFVTLSYRQAEFNKTLCRRDIIYFYECNKKNKTISLSDFERVMDMYTIYKSMGGNGTTEALVEEMKGWEKKV